MNVTTHPKPDTITKGNIVRYAPSDRVGIVTGFEIEGGITYVHMADLVHRGNVAMYVGNNICGPASRFERVEIDVPLDPSVLSRR